MSKKSLGNGQRHGNKPQAEEAQALRTSCAGGLACHPPSPTIPRDVKRFRRGQQVLEYAVLISAVAAAFYIMYVYGTRGLQGVIRSSAMQIGSQRDAQPVVESARTSGGSSLRETKEDRTHVVMRGQETTYIYNSETEISGTDSTVTVSH